MGSATHLEGGSHYGYRGKSGDRGDWRKWGGYGSARSRKKTALVTPESLTGIVPKKWRHRFPGVGAVDDRPRISIHKENMDSAAATIVKHIKPSCRIGELINLLQNKLKENQ